MQMLFYRGLSGNHAESSLVRMRYLPQNICWRWVLCQPLSTQQGHRLVCVSKFFKSQKCNKVMSHQKRKPEDHVWRKDMLELRRQIFWGGAWLLKKLKKKRKTRKETRARIFIFRYRVRSRRWEAWLQICSLCKIKRGLRWWWGDDCVNQFGTWLLDGTHQDAIVIAHNLRGYNGFLLGEYFTKSVSFEVLSWRVRKSCL